MIIKNVSRSMLSGVVGKTKYTLNPGETALIPDPLAAIWRGRKAAEAVTTTEAKDDDADLLDLDDDQDSKRNKKGKNN